MDNLLILFIGVIKMLGPDPHLVQKLKTYLPGANVHTVNKARCYYEWPELNQKRLMKLDGMIREALVSHDWVPLRFYMQRWF